MENYIFATYNYFYGMYIYKILKQENVQLEQQKLHFHNRVTIEGLSFYIIEHCWKYIAKKSKCVEVDHSKFADIFSCIFLLKHCDVNDIIDEFYSRQTENIRQCLQSNLTPPFLLGSLLNIIVNTIKCSRVFYQDSNYEALIVQRYKKIINQTFPTSLHSKHSYNYPQYKIAIDVNYDSDRLNKSLTMDKIQEWIQLVKKEIIPSLEIKVKEIISIKEIFNEINNTEIKLINDYRFSEWEDYIEIVDVNTCIWKESIKEVFEKRIYEIAQEKVNTIINEVESLLHSSETDLSYFDSNLLEFVWKDLTVSRNDGFINLILKSFDIVSKGFKVLFDDISVLKEKYPNYLSKIFTKVLDFFIQLDKRINQLKGTKQFILFGAVFFEKIVQQSSSIQEIFNLNKCSSLEETNWCLVENKIREISDFYYCNWFEFIIEKKFENFHSTLFVDLNNFLQNLMFWEKVVITEDSSVTSSNTNIEVPIQISLCTFEVIQNICSNINKHCAYMLSRKVVIYILSLIGQNMISVYKSAIENIKSSHYSQSAKQNISIQIYFDLFFFKNLFATIKEDNLRIGQLNKFNDLLTLLESMIDPFDLHIMFPYIQTNTDRLLKSCSITFGFLFTDKNVIGSMKMDSKSNINDSSIEVKHNIMLVNCCDFQFECMNVLVGFNIEILQKSY